MASPQKTPVPLVAAMALFALVVAAFLFAVFGRAAPPDAGGALVAADKWTCSMCPQFILPEPGKCPKCFMDLIPLDEGAFGGGKLDLVLAHDAAHAAGITTALAEHPENSGAPLRIPESAVLRNAGRAFVFVEFDDGERHTFTLREIETGVRAGGFVDVLSGLDEYESVAAAGVFRIDSAMQILGKTSLVNLPEGELSDSDIPDGTLYQAAERSETDARARGAALDDWFAEYERIRAALAKDEFAAADQPSRDLQSSLQTMSKNIPADIAELAAALSADAERLAGTDASEDKRAAFEKMSAGITLLARRYGAPSGGLNLVFCPMAFGGAGAYWLQPGETVDNPYHGLEMPLCGWLVDAIAPFGGEERSQ